MLATGKAELEGAQPFDVFISYSHQDEDEHGIARELAAWLEGLGYDVWWDHSLLVGDDWLTEITVKLRAARKVIALWSKRALTRPMCQHEALTAAADNKLLPVALEPLEQKDFTELLAGAVYRLNRIDYRRPKAHDNIRAKLNLKPSGQPLAKTAARDDARVSIAALPTGAGKLIGRDVELSRLDTAWTSTRLRADPKKKTNVVVLHAIGGAGKTALMRRFVDDLADENFHGAGKVFGWSAYSQGSGEDKNVDADKFLSDALRHFGHDVDREPITNPIDKGRKLAALVGRGRNLLIIDGLEPLQSPPHVNRGYLKDKGVAVLIKELAATNQGLLIITSRQELPELEGQAAPRVINRALDALDSKAGAELLRELGVWGPQKELEAAAAELEGHALSLSLLGSYLNTVYAGDIRKRDHFDFAEAVAGAAREGERRARRAQHVMAKYVERFAEAAQTAGGGQPEIAILRMLGLFDGPAPKEALDALLAEPAIPGLTDAFHGISTQQRSQRWAWAVRRLRALKLLNREDERDPGALDAHPVVREHFAAELKRTLPEACTAAHSRLYDHYRFAFLDGLDVPDALRTPEGYGLLADAAAYPDQAHHQPQMVERILSGQLLEWEPGVLQPSLLNANQARLRAAAAHIALPAFAAALSSFLPKDEAGMQPCFAAITHGCAAGRYDKAYFEVYWPRVRRGNADFATRQLGLFGAELSAIAQFFDVPFTEPAVRSEDRPGGLTEARQALVLSIAGYRLRALGRLAEAVAPMRATIDLDVENERWEHAGVNCSNLSELLLTLGRIAEAEHAGADSVTYADRSGNAFQRMARRANHADALHQAGETARAAELLADAERLQAERQRDLPRLYSLQGYRYCDLLLDQGRTKEVLERYNYVGAVRLEGDPRLDRGINELIAGRAHAALAVQIATSPTDRREHSALATRHLDDAVARLIAANTEHHIPRGLIARAAHRRWLYATTGDPAHFDSGGRDLADAEDIARRDEPNGGAMRLFLADIALERCRLALAQIDGPAARPRRGLIGRLLGTGPAPRPMAPADPELRRLAEAHWQQAADLVAATGYHRRDGELAELRAALDRLPTRDA